MEFNFVIVGGGSAGCVLANTNFAVLMLAEKLADQILAA